MMSVAQRIAAVCLFSLVVLFPHFSQAGWFDGNSYRPKVFSRQWWRMRAQDPPGVRQRRIAGKLWPPAARPTGKSRLPIHTFHSAQYWPRPYIREDRNYVRNLSQLQTNNGWIQATTLYDYHFDRDTHRLNKSGRLQLRWILEYAPSRHRTAFVQKTHNQESSQMRLANVQVEATSMVGVEQLPPILLRVASPVSRPAIEVDLIRRSELETIPEPRIVDPIESDSASPESVGG